MTKQFFGKQLTTALLLLLANQVESYRIRVMIKSLLVVMMMMKSEDVDCDEYPHGFFSRASFKIVTRRKLNVLFWLGFFFNFNILRHSCSRVNYNTERHIFIFNLETCVQSEMEPQAANDLEDAGGQEEKVKQMIRPISFLIFLRFTLPMPAIFRSPWD